ncbi:ABC-type glutamine/glutamate/polar amino acids transport system, substrate-binding protein [Haladaptatus paucihalophilus DX253]|uniref:ABC-type glutamine/glutamate/polar amino acids transport system, substrate-binding protein n=1 Tax=Haladaptatus paucihalophilus DX253 TaxID=797209 RepID=E7QQU2_HALPU|nr:basic amino acid ABC transporter substrate-binding protein [Haladaptatus paucihalophilus]EFW93356.1 ABC-type glutamine/glutamate/polar amino acids transport system, substrate-binding protein [Haladaptatus paucihalophilus DX253]SHK52357.1 amino acid ABC transporter substrate-binding protein, PAAT family [Haladaptatus paucihalophilus DX253]
MHRRSFLRGTGGAIAALTFAENASAQNNGTIRIGSDIPYRPFEYRTKTGELVGFDVDIANAVFEGQLDRNYEFVQTSFDTIIPSLNNGNFRVIMSAMTITPERSKQVDFSDPYFTAYQTVLILKNSDITSLQDLKGETVAVQKGTTGEAAAQDLKKQFNGDLTIDSYDQIPGAFSALGNNQAAAVINDNTVNAEFAQQNDNVTFLKGEGAAQEQGKENAPPYLTLTVEEYGIAFRKNDDQLKNQVNDALSTIRDNGTYDELYNKYFQTPGGTTSG